jgi:hypothetical protein
VGNDSKPLTFQNVVDTLPQTLGFFISVLKDDLKEVEVLFGIDFVTLS